MPPTLPALGVQKRLIVSRGETLARPPQVAPEGRFLGTKNTSGYPLMTENYHNGSKYANLVATRVMEITSRRGSMGTIVPFVLGASTIHHAQLVFDLIELREQRTLTELRSAFAGIALPAASSSS